MERVGVVFLFFQKRCCGVVSFLRRFPRVFCCFFERFELESAFLEVI